ncbi:hypothetical protein [Mobiluncus mulieris]|uniref:hypothetical protein n=1 Tax=Mobiluncus mulieris TaxID=2052 RepID=UPI00201645DE|nr:hypothetical protein [Mobiluncus mulieris]
MMKTFTVTAQRAGRWWALECAEAGCYSQCRRLDQVDDEMREAIAWQTGLAKDAFNIAVNIELPVRYQQQLQQTKQLQAEAEKLVASAASSSRLVAKEMKDDGFTLRDIGQVMGISYQRAGQLVAACNRD